MEWFNQRFAMYEKAEADRKAVQQSAEDIYSQVWKAIGEVAGSAKARGISLKNNGIPYRFALRMVDRTMTLKLDDDKCGITAEISDSPGVTLKLRICPDGTVCIKHEGATVDYAGAARVIMEAFFFGERSPYALLFPDA